MSMPTVKLGRTGLDVSRVVLGTMTFGLQCDEPTSRAILDRAAEAGVNFIDTADVYPLGGALKDVGRTEEILGRWLEGRRESFVVATKAVGKMGEHPWNQGASRKHLLSAIDASLRRLKTDYVDLYQLHSDDLSTPLDETLEALDAIRASGKARYVGVSNFLSYRLATMLGRADVKGLVRPVTVQPRYSLLFREIERELLPLALEQGLGVIPYNPIAGGLLSGKYASGSKPQSGTRFTLGSAGELYQRRYWHDREFATVAALEALAREAGAPLATIAVAWTLANPAITAPIIGASRPDQLAATIAGATYGLDQDLKAKLDALTAEYRRGDAPR